MSNQNRQQGQTNKKVQQGELSRREMFDVGLANKEAQFKKMINRTQKKNQHFQTILLHCLKAVIYSLER